MKNSFFGYFSKTFISCFRDVVFWLLVLLVVTYLISYSISYTRLLGVVVGSIPNVTNPWVELTIENQLTKEGQELIKLLLNSCRTLES